MDINRQLFLLVWIPWVLKLNDLFGVQGHGRLMNPPNRSSLWRFQEFDHYNLTKNYLDNGLWCGGFEVQYGFNDGKCGLCGDAWNDTIPRDNEDGGLYGQGIITRRYKAGQVFTADVDLTSPHGGYWELRLCPTEPVTQECFDRHPLQFPGTGGMAENTKFYVRHRAEDDHESRYYSVAVKLPKRVKSSRATIQWTYTTGTRWGECEDGKQGLGCGPQEIFRNCADVAIY